MASPAAKFGVLYATHCADVLATAQAHKFADVSTCNILDNYFNPSLCGRGDIKVGDACSISCAPCWMWVEPATYTREFVPRRCMSRGVNRAGV
jgi:hypothetical protein